MGRRAPDTQALAPRPELVTSPPERQRGEVVSGWPCCSRDGAGSGAGPPACERCGLPVPPPLLRTSGTHFIFLPLELGKSRSPSLLHTGVMHRRAPSPQLAQDPSPAGHHDSHRGGCNTAAGSSRAVPTTSSLWKQVFLFLLFLPSIFHWSRQFVKASCQDQDYSI